MSDSTIPLPMLAIPSPINEIVDQLGANDLPYTIPIHPNLVHFHDRVVCDRNRL